MVKRTSLRAKLYIELALSKELPSAAVAVAEVEAAALEVCGGLDQELVVAEVPVVVPVSVEVLAVT